MHIAGPLGYAADSGKAFKGIDSTLLFATVAVVIVLLLVTYRSPVLWLLPVISAGIALTFAQALIYLLAAHAGLTVNAQSAGILYVLVFGAGTDYALLLTARYREELRRHQDRHEAMAVALRRAGPAVIASGGTVIVSLLILAVSELTSTKGTGPVLATGVAVALAAMLTLLPALSFAATLGVSALVFNHVFGFGGADSSFPLFVFLVALGIDYNIFLMTRVREETHRHGPRTGALTGLAATGGVITSAGVVLAGTFAVLGTLPVTFLTELGFAVAFGVLLDTIVVRPVLVTALNLPVDLVAKQAHPPASPAGRHRRRAARRRAVSPPVSPGSAAGSLALYAGFRRAAFSVAGPLSAVAAAGLTVLAGGATVR
ncbi:MAG TPA: MMPL family transporter [Trebonia sp.]